MRLTIALVALLAMMFVVGEARADDAAMKEALAPLGTLFVGVAVGPTPGPATVAGDRRHGYSGVAVDLGTELAQKLGVEVEFLGYPSSDFMTLLSGAGEWRVAFMAVDAKRKEKLEFGSAYIVLRATYLVRPGSGIKRLADVDKRRVRVASIDDTATARAAARSLKNATVTNVKSVDESLELLKSGKADAIALSREAAIALSAKLPDSRVLDGAFWKSYVAIAIPNHTGFVVSKGDGNDPSQNAVLDYLSAFIDSAIASGSVRRALDKVGMQTSVVAQPGTRP